MYEVDVFEYPRFCDEFSHVVNKRFCCDCRSPLKSHIDGLDVLDYLKVLLNCQIYYLVFNNPFLQFNKCVK